jgi:uncharacterized protein YkwD
MTRSILVASIIGVSTIAVSSCSADDEIDYKRDCPQGDSSEQCALFHLVNRERAEAGLEPYDWDPALAQAAQAHCEDMAANGYFDHEGADGSTFGERASRAGYDGSATGENIARGGETADRTLDQWMNSSGHRDNLLSNRSTETGIGFCDGDLWVQVFGRASAD